MLERMYSVGLQPMLIFCDGPPGSGKTTSAVTVAQAATGVHFMPEVNPLPTSLSSQTSGPVAWRWYLENEIRRVKFAHGHFERTGRAQLLDKSALGTLAYVFASVQAGSTPERTYREAVECYSSELRAVVGDAVLALYEVDFCESMGRREARRENAWRAEWFDAGFLAALFAFYQRAEELWPGPVQRIDAGVRQQDSVDQLRDILGLSVARPIEVAFPVTEAGLREPYRSWSKEWGQQMLGRPIGSPHERDGHEFQAFERHLAERRAHSHDVMFRAERWLE